MSIYLPNTDVGPIGAEPTEFIDYLVNAAPLTRNGNAPAAVLGSAEPQEIDESRSMELRHVSTEATLRTRPIDDQHCRSCRYYLEDTADLSYCWHPKLRILVGADWWCQWWASSSETD